MCGVGTTPKAARKERGAGDAASPRLEGWHALGKSVFHRFCRALLHCGQHVRVGIERDGYGGGPSISETILGLTFSDKSSVAQVCRTSWKRICGNPARLSKGLKGPLLCNDPTIRLWW